ncbi:conserved hypothetical protein [Staphylococcus capitis]|nr:conserved hypothetical protein [Staphylococcus capitis]
MNNVDLNIGDRVKLIRTEDEYTHLKPGACGTVKHIDDMKQIHVVWDEGVVFALIPDLDIYEKI